jgi:hypothetical protein
LWSQGAQFATCAIGMLFIQFTVLPEQIIFKNFEILKKEKVPKIKKNYVGLIWDLNRGQWV